MFPSREENRTRLFPSQKSTQDARFLKLPISVLCRAPSLYCCEQAKGRGTSPPHFLPAFSHHLKHPATPPPRRKTSPSTPKVAS
ncbi:hypothetical protein VTH06DRAFT_1479 [Thermothelomyces fergusii]